MKFKGKTMYHPSWGATAWFHYSNCVVCIKCFRLSIGVNNNAVVGNELESQCNNLRSFLRWGEFNLLFNVDIVNLPLKNNGGETESLMLLFL